MRLYKQKVGAEVLRMDFHETVWLFWIFIKLFLTILYKISVLLSMFYDYRCFIIEQFIFAHVEDIKMDNKKLWTHSLLSSMETDRILFLVLMYNIFNNTMYFLDQSTNILLNMTRETKVPKKRKRKKKGKTRGCSLCTRLIENNVLYIVCV